jgi:transposase
LVVATPEVEEGVVAQGRARAAIQAGRPPLRSPGRPPVNRREEQQRFWRKVAEGLSSEEAAVASGVSPVLGTRWFREAGGMPPISSVPPSGRYLSFAEREEIALLRAQGCGVRDVAHHLGRAPSTISRELRRNAATRGGRLDYRALVAQWHADRAARRPKVSKLAAGDRLQEYVQDRLAGVISAPDGTKVPGPQVCWIGRRHGRRKDRRWARAWSPEQIANRLKVDFPEDETMRICHEAIYQALYIQGARGAETRAGGVPADRPGAAGAPGQDPGPWEEVRHRGGDDQPAARRGRGPGGARALGG